MGALLQEDIHLYSDQPNQACLQSHLEDKFHLGMAIPEI